MMDEDFHAAPTVRSAARFKREVCAGLSKTQKSIPCQFFYDDAGSALFERITDLPEYYPTRTEIGILRACADEIASRTPDGATLVEFGSGSSVKTEILLAARPSITRYIPIDVSPASLEGAQARLQALFPKLRVTPVVGDFSTGELTLPDLCGAAALGFFPGSTIGNFTHESAVELLGRFKGLLGPDSRLIVGADLRKSSDILIPAYNDAAGVTAAFNLNLLVRINRELAGTFDLARFEHLATYDIETGRIDMYLVSAADQSVMVAGRRFEFATGERIHTEISQKYHVEELQALARRAGWRVVAAWTDPQRLFSLHELAALT